MISEFFKELSELIIIKNYKEIFYYYYRHLLLLLLLLLLIYFYIEGMHDKIIEESAGITRDLQ